MGIQSVCESLFLKPVSASDIFPMRICVWALHLDDDAFVTGCKNISDYLNGYIIIGSCHRILVPVFVFAITLQLGHAMLNVGG